jgi:hypothetical protein
MREEEKIIRHAAANKTLQAAHPGFSICYRVNSARKVVALGAYDANWEHLHSVRVESGTAMQALDSLPELIKLLDAVVFPEKVVPDRTGVQAPAPQSLIRI